MHAGTSPTCIYAATLLFMMHYLGFRVGPAITIVGPRQNLKDTHVFQLAHLRISCRMQVIRMTCLHTGDVRCQEGEHAVHERRTYYVGCS